MKTDDLIAALAADAARPSIGMGIGIALAAVVGAVAAALAVGMAIGVRPDVAAALSTWRFDAKIAIVALSAITACADCVRQSRPTADGRLPAAAFLAAALLAVAMAVELGSTPRSEWGARAIGTNAFICLVTIPALAIVPSAALLFAMRRGAPRFPARAGAAAGLAAAAIAAFFYALHCTDDSPLFVGAWYPLAMSVVVGATALAGVRLLRW